MSAVAALAGHAWAWRSPALDGDYWVTNPRPLHLASCPCWSNGGVLPVECRRPVRRPRSSLWAALFGPAQDRDWNE